MVTQNVDLWFEDLADPKLAAALKKAGAAYVPPIMLNPPMLAGTGTEMFDIVRTQDFEWVPGLTLIDPFNNASS